MAGLIDSDLLNRYHTRGVVPIDTRLTQAEADIAGKGDTLSYDDENAVLSLKSGSTVLSSVSVGGGATRIRLADVSGALATVSANTVSLTWTDPADVVVSGTTLAAWSGTKVVRKAGSAPQNELDGTVVVNSRTRNAYSSTAFEDTGLAYDTTYYYRFFPYTTDNVVTNGSSVSASPERITISTLPSQSGALTYNGSQQTATFTNYDPDQLTVTGSTGTNAGTYTAVFTPKEGYQWSDETLTGKSVSWSIGKRQITIPQASGTYTYDGTLKTATVTGLDQNNVTAAGITGTNAGSYTAMFTLNDSDNNEWTDGTTAYKSSPWTINKATLPIPTQSGTLTYNTLQQTASFSDKDLTKMSVTGDSATNAGTYTAVFSLLDTANYQWTGGTAADQSVTWVIGVKSVSVPTLSNTTKTYNGSSQSPTISVYDSNEITVSGDTSATNASTTPYTVYFDLTSTANYQWSDSTTATKSATWTIGKAAGGLSINKNSVTLGTSTPSDTVTCTVTGDGTVSAVSSDPTVATASVSGNIVTINNVNQANGSATITISVGATNNYTAPADKTVSVTAQFVSIYGAEWDGTSTTAWSRTDASASFTDPVPYVAGASSYGSPFDTLQPWVGMTKVTDADAGELVAIPKFWYKLTQNGNAIKVQIADGPVSGFSVSPAHMNRGDGAGARDVVYVGRYHCAESTYKSTTGVKPQARITRSAARSSIHNLGTKIWQSDFATRFTLWLLYIVEFADWNSQAKIGKGCGDGSATGNMGYTDTMPYHTGTTQNSRDTFGLGTQYRNIEGLWDNVRDWCDGCYYNSSGLNIILNPGDFSDSTGGSVAGLPTSGYPSKFTVNSTGGYPVFYPTESNGSDSTVSCDSWHFNASNPCLYVGGNYSQYAYVGLFYVNNGSAASTYAYIGCRLLKLP